MSELALTRSVAWQLLQFARTNVWPRCSLGDICAIATLGNAMQSAIKRLDNRGVMLLVSRREPSRV